MYTSVYSVYISDLSPEAQEVQNSWEFGRVYGVYGMYTHFGDDGKIVFGLKTFLHVCENSIYILYTNLNFFKIH